MKRTIVISIWTLAVALFAVLLVTKTRVGLILAQAQGPGPSFTAVRQTKQFTEDGKNTFTELLHVGVRSDGSRAEKRISRNQSTLEMRVIVDVGSATKTVLDANTKSKTTYALPANEIMALRYQPSSCVIGSQPVEQSTILDIPVVKVTTPATPGQPSVEVVRWKAPSLNCFSLRTEAREVSAGGVPKGSTSVEETLSVTIGVPDTAMFAIPADYQERYPSEVLEKARQQAGRAPCPECGSRDSKLDEAYRKNR